jgi:predicted nucleic-acid-binding protein
LEHTKSDGIFVSMVVLAEVAWVLAAAYEWDRSMIHDRLSRLVRTRGVVLEELELVEGALEQYVRGPADFADYLVVGKARSVGANLLTFDKRLGRAQGVRLL